MNTLILFAILVQPTIYVALDDETNSKHLYSELTRDWTVSDYLQDRDLAKAREVNADIKEFKSLINIVIERPNFIRQYPAFRFSKYQKWTAIDNRAFSSSGRAYKTLMYHAYSYYKDYYKRKFNDEYIIARKNYYDATEKIRQDFIKDKENYTRNRPWNHWPGYGNVYNLQTRKYEHIKLPRNPQFPLDDRPEQVRNLEFNKAWDKWKRDKLKIREAFCKSNPNYVMKMPKDHHAGYGDVYNMVTRKYENIELNLTKPVLMELRVDPLPYKE